MSVTLWNGIPSCIESFIDGMCVLKNSSEHSNGRHMCLRVIIIKGDSRYCMFYIYYEQYIIGHVWSVKINAAVDRKKKNGR